VKKKRFSVVAVVFEPKGNAFLCFSFGFYINAAPPSQKHRCKDTFFFVSSFSRRRGNEEEEEATAAAAI